MTNSERSRVRTAVRVGAGLIAMAACGGDDQASVDARLAVDAVVAIDAAVAPDACAGAGCPLTPRPIQELQDGTVGEGVAVAVDKVFVTGLRLTAAGSVLAFVQEPDGVTTGGHTYPEFAGVQLFVAPAEAAMFPGLGTLQVGDCISIAGATLEFQSDTEIVTPTAFRVEPAGTCGTAPTPLVLPAGAVNFDALATDTDPATGGEQPGASAETYEGVLLKVNGVTAVAATDGAGVFRVTRNGGGAATLEIGWFMYPAGGPVPATAGQVFTSITGVYAQRNVFQLLPRGPADMQ